MKRNIAVSAALAMVLAAPTAAAQDIGDFAAWIALVSTPVGALPPAPALARGDGVGTSPTLVLRYGHWQFARDDDNTSIFGVGLRLRKGTSDIRIDAGLERVSDCDDCGGFLLGVDFDTPLGSRDLGGNAGPRGATLDLGINPAVGYFKPSEGDGSAISVAVSFPVKLTAPLSATVRMAPFLSPGMGLGMVQGGGESESGFRAMLGGGFAIGGDDGRLQATIGFRKIFLEDAPTMWGVAFSIGR